jgi:hypothetical protein
VWNRGVHAGLRETPWAEKHARDQAEASNPAGFIRVARIASSKRNKEGVGRNVAVATEDATGTLPEVGNDDNIGLVIAGAGFQPYLPLAHVVGRSKVCVSVTAPDLNAVELVYQKEVDHTGYRVRTINGRSAILQDVDVIDHRERNKINVHASAEPGNAQRTRGDAFSINQNQSLLGQQTAQVELDSTVTTIAEATADVQVDGATRLLRQKRLQIGRIANPQLLDVCRSISVHRIWAGLFRGRNIGPSHNHALDFRPACN